MTASAYAVLMLSVSKPEIAEAKVLVLELRDEAGTPVEGVSVTFFGEPSPTCKTDGSGACRRDTDLPHLDVEATKDGYLPIRSRFNFADSRGVVALTIYSRAHEDAAQKRREIEDQARARAQKAKDETTAREAEARANMRVSMVSLADDLDLCAAQGLLLRGESLTSMPPFLNSDDELLTKEFARRRLSFNRAQAKEETLSRGMSECSMAASYGRPTKRNRSVGSWGVRVQYVYEQLGMYIYTRNGRVDSWQD
ncbi:hypothetical protein CDL60_26225 [Roseateles noduli]|nr:hypothetical protein CDL60_26225 [Roseateles noduli]